MRRVGKTTALHQLVRLLDAGPSPPEFLYVDFGVPVFKQTSIAEILDVHARLRGRRAEVVVLLDELHTSPDWEGWLRTEVERRTGHRFIATGSAAALLRERGAESGVGRWDEIHMPPLLLPEFMALRNEPAPDLPSFDPAHPPDAGEYWNAYLPRRGDLAAARMDYVEHGGFPEWALIYTRQEDRESAQQSLREDVVDKVLGRDLTSVFGISRPDHLERLFLYVCLSTGGIFNESRASKALGISRSTTGNYVDYLERGFLVTDSKPLAIAAGPTLRARSKLYVTDASLRNAVLFRGRRELADDPTDAGCVMEMTVTSTLKALAHSKGLRLGYFRDSRNHDLVDAVVGTQAVPEMGVEVKFQASIGKADVAGLRSFGRIHREAASILLVDGTRFSPSDDVPAGITVLPVDGFLWSVGRHIVERARARIAPHRGG